jgi:hypothetical protein
MDVSKFAVTCFEGPFLMGIQVSKSDVVDDHILDEGVSELGVFVPIDADLHVDFLGIFLLLGLDLGLGDEIFLQEVEAVEFLDGEEVGEVLKWGHEYIVKLLLSLENGLLGLVGRSKQLPAWEFGEDDVQLEFGDKFL